MPTPETPDQPKGMPTPLGSATNLNDLLDEHGRIKGSPVNEEDDE